MGLYEDLGLSKNATPEEIRKAYRSLARQHHPDKGGDPEQFKKIQEAYEVLSDPEKRSNFDQFGTADAPQGMGGPFPPDMFASMFGGFGGPPRGPKRRADHEHVVTVTLEEAWRGLSRNLRISLARPCAACQSKCGQCGGRGSLTHQMGPFAMNQPCGACQMQGKVCKGCSTCNFQKVIIENLNYELRIPKWVESGHVVTARGLGEQARDEDEEPGDLHFRIVVKDHPVFMRQGKDLIYTENISFEESVLGKVVRVPHFDGEIEVDTRRWGPLDPREDYVVPLKDSCRLRLAFAIQYPGPSSWKLERQQ